jgi:hypothetical protein
MWTAEWLASCHSSYDVVLNNKRPEMNFKLLDANPTLSGKKSVYGLLKTDKCKLFFKFRFGMLIISNCVTQREFRPHSELATPHTPTPARHTSKSPRRS